MCDSLPVFCAARMSRIPVMSDELNDVAAIRYELAQLKQQLERWTKHVEESIAKLQNNVCELQHGYQVSVNNCITVQQPPGNSVASQHIDSVVDNGQLMTTNVAQLPVHTASLASSVSDTHSPLALNTEVVHNYADAITRPPTNDDKFTFVQRKAKTKQQIVIGSPTASGELDGVAKEKVVCVSRLCSNTTVDKVWDCLKGVVSFRLILFRLFSFCLILFHLILFCLMSFHLFLFRIIPFRLIFSFDRRTNNNDLLCRFFLCPFDKLVEAMRIHSRAKLTCRFQLKQI